MAIYRNEIKTKREGEAVIRLRLTICFRCFDFYLFYFR